MFKKKEKETFPPEYAEINFSENALRKGITDDLNKQISIIRWDNKTGKFKKKVRGYSDSLLYVLRKKLRLPILDNTGEIEFPVYGTIDLSKIKYLKG